VEYSSEFKRLVIYKLLSQPSTSIRRLAEETGVSKSTLWDWKREVCRVAGTMADSTDDSSGGRDGSRSRDRSVEEKLRLVREADGLSECDLGAFLRREGLQEEELTQWRDSMSWALQTSSQRMADRKQARTLARQLRKTEKELKEARALLELQKKVQEMWGDDEDDDTPSSNDS
jgi:transposase-like protein